jgi:hypothetical protein
MPLREEMVWRKAWSKAPAPGEPRDTWRWLGSRLSDRRQRLFLCACCRLVLAY